MAMSQSTSFLFRKCPWVRGPAGSPRGRRIDLYYSVHSKISTCVSRGKKHPGFIVANDGAASTFGKLSSVSPQPASLSGMLLFVTHIESMYAVRMSGCWYYSTHSTYWWIP